MSTLQSQVSVLIVGSGPSGLSAAAAAITKGVNPEEILIVEKRTAEAREAFKLASRANAIHAGTLERLEEDLDGVVEKILKEAVLIRKASIFERGSSSSILPGDFTWLPTKFNHITIISQHTVESILESHLESLNNSPRYGFEFVSFTQQEGDSYPLTVELKSQDSQETVKVKTKFLVAADGWNSQVRQNAAIDFEGAAYPNRYLLGDVRFNDPLWPHSTASEFQGCSYLGPNGPLLIMPTPGGLTRIVAEDKTFDPKKADLDYHGFSVAETKPTIHELQKEVDQRGPVFDQEARPNQIMELIWSSRFRVHHRLAKTFRRGSVLLVGDAAHIHSPVGGQGMNLGIIDSLTLGTTLASILALPPSPGLEKDIDTRLEEWAVQRRDRADKVVKFTDRATRITTLSNPILIWLRNRFLRFMAYWFPHVMRRGTLDMSGLQR